MRISCSYRSARAQPAGSLQVSSAARSSSKAFLEPNGSFNRSRLGLNEICCSLTRRTEDVSASISSVFQERDAIRMGLPSKGRMAEDTQQLLSDCQMKVYKPNPRQYVANIPQLPGLEVWFQRASDVVRKLRYGDIDIGIVGYDMFAEFAEDDQDLIIIHPQLRFGHCRLSLGVPMGGKFAAVESLAQLKAMGWSQAKPLRVVTGYQSIARRFFAEKGFEHVAFLAADGALEAAPAMGCADIILDLVSTGVTLRENNLKEIKDGEILKSQGVLVANRQALLHRPGILALVKELIERLDAHLVAEDFYSVIANMRGDSEEEVAQKLFAMPGLEGLQGPTISPVFTSAGENGVTTQHGFYATVICVPKKQLYSSVKAIRKVGGSGVLVQPMTYIFNEESPYWKKLLEALDLDDPFSSDSDS